METSPEPGDWLGIYDGTEPVSCPRCGKIIQPREYVGIDQDKEIYCVDCVRERIRHFQAIEDKKESDAVSCNGMYI